ncbi:hypothetical protein DICPUDRAFT_83375 [Dictyostelium purpureum]|uniref:BRCT domain-containing protein n=1 Tax=Dictyostelium purpureum TaxID=5786 RepID=F0ZZC6_DICPU|nr:uncharacterized protein DICPUDRAFT_83375 [Dictyostelium purpureum]EGC30708.1 hypothetical protein DICPUDRAFT_83375 [Dictyostelium purpureum]|eukprot:XP_003292771.1 hypothetical protein DICPUDRAFT_83375 [Dictyostelium purpureum]
MNSKSINLKKRIRDEYNQNHGDALLTSQNNIIKFDSKKKECINEGDCIPIEYYENDISNNDFKNKIIIIPFCNEFYSSFNNLKKIIQKNGCEITRICNFNSNNLKNHIIILPNYNINNNIFFNLNSNNKVYIESNFIKKYHNFLI